jgi:ABC-type multidrug transport system ATPase subunit
LPHLDTLFILEIILENIGKRFNRDWIFRDVNVTFTHGVRCAILGNNGSGKSTFLQLISGFLVPGAGQISWKKDNQLIDVDQVYSHIAIATPFLALYDQFTLQENVDFFLKFKKFKEGIDAKSFAEVIQLEQHRNKQLQHFSSGMRQRVKLGLAILADTPVLLLDEPVSHLDKNAIAWFRSLLENNVDDRSLFVASNSHPDETFLCNQEWIMQK